MRIRHGVPVSLWNYTLVRICHWRGTDAHIIEASWVKWSK